MNLVKKLRNPTTGCSWDLAQTHQSLIPYVIQEAHEVAYAIRHEGDKELLEELGDLLLQVVLHAQIANENNKFNFLDVVRRIRKKLIKRHPHIFDKIESLNYEEARESWEKIKESEEDLNSPLSDQLKKRIRSQSAIYGAMTISQKVAKEGFDSKSIDHVWEKVDEELKELKEALYLGDMNAAQKELGDVLFTVINIARWFNLNPEEGLAGTNKRFLDRLFLVEKNIKGRIQDHSVTELKKLWERAKKFLIMKMIYKKD